MKFVEDATGDIYYLHAPLPLGPGSFTHYLLEAGSIAKTLWHAFKPYTAEVETLLEDLPWE